MNRHERRQYAREHGVPMPPPDAEQPQVVPAVPLGPVPTATDVGVLETPDGGLVVLQVFTPVGPAAYFLSADHAQALAAVLTQAAMSASTGLQIVGDVRPDGAVELG